MDGNIISTSNLMIEPAETTHTNRHDDVKLSNINEAMATKMEGTLIDHISSDLSLYNKITNDIYYKLNLDSFLYEEKDKSSLGGVILELLEEYRKEFLYVNATKLAQSNKELYQKMEGVYGFMKSAGLGNDIIKAMKKTLASTGTKHWEKYTDTSKCLTLSKIVIHKLVDEKFGAIVNRQKYQLPIKNKQIIDLEYDEPLVRTRGRPYEIPAGINKNPKQISDYFTYQLDVNYTPRNEKNKAQFELLDKYILDLSTGDKDKALFLKTILGAILIKGNPSQKFFLFTGSGSNGKSMLLNIINHIFNELKVDISADLLVDQKGRTKGGADPFLIEMNNPKTRLMLLSETKEGINFDEALIKRLTGDDNIKARALYSNKTQQFKVDAMLFVVSNHRPKFNVYDYGMKRRPNAVDFNSTFVKNPTKPGEYKKDPTLFEKLTKNKDILFSWFVEGAMLYKKNPMLDVPDIIKTETENYFYELDSVSQYLEVSSERVKITNDKKDRIQQNQLFQDYVDFCKQNNITFSKKSIFYTNVGKKLDIKKVRGIMHFTGVQWADDGDDVVQEYI